MSPKVLKQTSADPTANNLLVGSTTNFTHEEWDKGRIGQNLVAELGLKPEVAEQIAQSVELIVLRAGLETVTTAEIRTLVQAELLSRGMRAKFKKGNLAVMSFNDLEALMLDGNQENSNVPHNPEAINLYIGENIVKQFALDSNRVFSQEVAAAHKDGYIHLHDLGLVERPYSFLHSETLLISIDDKIKLCSFERLFSLVKFYCKAKDTDETIDTTSINLQVWDRTKWTKITRVLKHRTDKKLLAIRTQNGHTVCVTEDHPFLVSKTNELRHECACGSYDTIRNGGLTATTRAYKCLECGTCFTQPLQEYSEELVVKPAADITRYNICVTQAKPAVNIDSTIVNLSVEQAWFIGYFIAEGFYDKDRAIAIRANDIDRAFDSVGSTFMGIDITPKLDAEGRLRIYSTKLADLLEHGLGIAAYSHRKSLPDDFVCWPKDIQAAIVSGIIDGDGTGEYSPEVSIRVTSKTMVSQIQWWLQSNNIQATVTAIASYGLREFDGKTIESKLQLYNVAFTVTTAVKDLLHLCNKLEGIQLYTTTRSKGPVSNFSKVTDIRHIDNTDKDGYVYDITTESGTFVCGGIVVHNCSGNSPAYVIRYGLSSKAYTNPSKPAKHLMVLINHIKEFSSLLQGHYAGAIGWDAVNVFLAPFCSGLADEQIKQAAQDLVFSFSQLLGTRGGQAIFSDLNFYYEIPQRYKDTYALGPGGNYIRKWVDELGLPHTEFVHDLPKNHEMFKANKKDGFLTYEDFITESQKFLRACVEVYRKGDANGLPFFFPKANVHITKDFWRTPFHEGFLELLASAAAANGSLYFIFERGDVNSMSQCCRLRVTMSDAEVEAIRNEPWKLRFCALQNITINMPRLAIEAARESEDIATRLSAYKTKLDKYMGIAVEGHIQKKKFITKLLALKEHGPLAALTYAQDGQPYFNINTTRFLIGIIGLNEVVQAITGKELHEDGTALEVGLDIIAYMYLSCQKLSKEHKMTIALEQTPAESTAYRFAKLDLEKYPEAKKLIKGDHKTGSIYFTNSTHIAADSNVGLVDRILLEGLFHGAIDAGSITHAWMGDSNPDHKALAVFLRKIYDFSQNDQVVFSPTFTRCNECLAVQKGEHKKCGQKECESENVTFVTRVTGYYGEVDKWNKGKKQERADRKQHGERAMNLAATKTPPEKEVVLFGKVGCGICETTKQNLDKLKETLSFKYTYYVIDPEQPLQSAPILAALLLRNVRDIPTLIIGNRVWSTKMPTISTIESTLISEEVAKKTAKG